MWWPSDLSTTNYIPVPTPANDASPKMQPFSVSESRDCNRHLPYRTKFAEFPSKKYPDRPQMTRWGIKLSNHSTPLFSIIWTTGLTTEKRFPQRPLAPSREQNWTFPRKKIPGPPPKWAKLCQVACLYSLTYSNSKFLASKLKETRKTF